MKKTSPVYIVAFLYRFALLLVVVPLQAILFEGISPQSAVYLYRADIAFALFLFAWAILSYRSIGYLCTDGRLRIKKGLLLQSLSLERFSSFDSITVSRRLLLRPFKLCYLNMTCARHHISLYLSNTDTHKLITDFSAETNGVKKISRSGVLGTLLMSAGFSNSLTGLLAAVPVLRNAATVVGQRQAAAILSGIDLEGLPGFVGIPPVLRAVSIILLLAWIVGFTAEFFRHFCLSIGRYEKLIVVSRGFFTKRHTIFRRDALSAVVLKQSILLSLLSLYTAEVHIPCEGRQEALKILPACKKSRCIETLSLPTFEKHQGNSTLTLAPSRDALWGYTYPPMTFLSAVCLLCIFADRYNIYNLPPYFSGFFLAMCIVWFFFRVAAHRRSALTKTNNGLYIKSFKKLTFTESYIPKEKVRAVKFSESILQRKRGLCTLKIYIRGRRRQSFMIKHINKEKAAQLLDI